MTNPPVIRPDWPAPPGIMALSTLRTGGCSTAPYDSFNLGAHVGDDPDRVRANRSALGALLPGCEAIAWLEQVHGNRVVEARGGTPQEADAQWSNAAGCACAVLTADCLPVLLCSRGGDAVAAAHAGWRGLAAGVLENTVAALDTSPDQLLAWLGPAIGPDAFEVGRDVREAFLAAPSPDGVAACFAPAPRPGHYFADLYALARLRLAAAGVKAVFGGGACTWSEPGRFFSYRRDGVTGRMATLIYRQNPPSNGVVPT